MIKIYSFKNNDDAGRAAAKVYADVLKNKPDAVFAFATGSSPLPLYNALVDMYEKGEISFAKVKTVNLDEYVGLSADHDQSYSYFMHKNLFNRLDVKEENVNLPNGKAECPECEKKRYDSVIEGMGGIDIQLLGIGNNGHIGFNEPTDYFSYGTTLVDLTDSTIDANSRFFERREDVPTQAFTMGIGHIMSAKKIVFVANGKGKAQIMEDAFFGRVTPEVPASILQFYQGEVLVFADEDALSIIAEKHPEAIIAKA